MKGKITFTASRVITASVFFTVLFVLTAYLRKSMIFGGNPQITVGAFSDAFTLPGFFLLAVAFFGAVDFPALDIFSYAHLKIKASFSRDKSQKNSLPKTFIEFRKNKPVIDKNWTGVWFIFGLVSILAGAILLAVYYLAF